MDKAWTCQGRATTPLPRPSQCSVTSIGAFGPSIVCLCLGMEKSEVGNPSYKYEIALGQIYRDAKSVQRKKFFMMLFIFVYVTILVTCILVQAHSMD